MFENNNLASLRHVTVDAVVFAKEKILLVKRGEKLLEGGKWAMPGGFMDRDETTKQAIEREIMEETGYAVKNIRLLTIRDNPDRPGEDRQNVSFIFFCEADEKTGKSDDESTQQKWFSLDELPNEEEMAFDHAESIKLYLRYRKEIFNIPVFNNYEKH
jgi:8-oxo-dGTP diphosphatase